MTKLAVAILASGSGSTAEALIRDLQQHDYPYEVRLVITNNPDAFVLQRINNLNTEFGLSIETKVINSKTQPTAHPVAHGTQTDEEQQSILRLLESKQIELVVLLGYMKRVGRMLTHAFGWRAEYTDPHEARMLNTHPGLLPETKGLYGLHVQEAVLARGLPYAGQTLHIVAEEYDDGPTVAEHRVAVVADETAEALFARVQTIEKSHIAADIAEFVITQQNRKEQ